MPEIIHYSTFQSLLNLSFSTTRISPKEKVSLAVYFADFLMCLLPGQSTPLVWPSFITVNFYNNYKNILIIQPGRSQTGEWFNSTCNHLHVHQIISTKTSVENFQNNFVATLYKHFVISLKTRVFVCRLAVSVYNFVGVVFM